VGDLLLGALALALIFEGLSCLLAGVLLLSLWA
jgi:hypothetical protein